MNVGTDELKLKFSQPRNWMPVAKTNVGGWWKTWFNKINSAWLFLLAIMEMLHRF